MQKMTIGRMRHLITERRRGKNEEEQIRILDMSGYDFRGLELEKKLKGLIRFMFRINFSGSDFRGADLSHVSLWESIFIGADLRGPDTKLYRACCSRADFTVAKLSGADLSHAGLSDVILDGADLQDADLSGAYLWGASLHGTNLLGVKWAEETRYWFEKAKIGGADFRGADLDLQAIVALLPKFALIEPDREQFLEEYRRQLAALDV